MEFDNKKVVTQIIIFLKIFWSKIVVNFVKKSIIEMIKILLFLYTLHMIRF